jgi:hypothetical protein
VKRPFLKLVLAAAFFACTPLSSGCGLQGEGERCSVLNVDTTGASLDCDTSLGLVCKRAADLGGNSDICCPSSRLSSKYDCVPHAAGNGSSSSSGSSGGSSGSGSGGASASSSSSSSSASSSSGGLADAGGGG